MMARPGTILAILIPVIVIAGLCLWHVSPATVRWGAEHLQREAGKGEARPPSERRMNKFVLHELDRRVVAGSGTCGMEV